MKFIKFSGGTPKSDVTNKGIRVFGELSASGRKRPWSAKGVHGEFIILAELGDLDTVVERA